MLETIYGQNNNNKNNDSNKNNNDDNSDNNGGHIVLRWDMKNLEIKTRSVEKTLEPLVIQVTTLVNTKGPSKKKKGRSKRAHVLVAAVEAATANFIERGEEIAYENPDIRGEMLGAVEEVRKTGDTMSRAAREFAEDPCSSVKRGNMVRAARNLLSAVTRLLILADMVDVHRLLKSLQVVEDDLEKVKNASSQSELLDNFRLFGKNTNDLINQAAKRQNELKDPRLRDDLASARAVLKKNSMMLLTASKAYVRHPELAAAKANRDFVFKQVCEAVNTISDVAQGKATGAGQVAYEGPGELASALDDFDGILGIVFKQVCEAVNTISDVAQGKATGAGQVAYEGPGELASALDDFDGILGIVFKQVCEAVNTISDVAQGKATGAGQVAYEGPGELASALDDFDERINMDPLTYNEVRTRPSLEERLESIISGAALMADSFCTRDDRRLKIVEECNAVRQALQDLLTEYMDNVSNF
ncbi:hypothetical protein Pcinc_035996 [Petrolisthes cinctipes]|uniref:Catenin alpha n=1 Tax=Petrolisthes cinctipes TaxID=88211 RepID=A0AAE1BYP1_PETCI|nr:hypothetical protein Pcinc_035996 [Petrolisthes cinctipes]